ncbi:unnamed protein product (macronuclear) [Paramecium tetraurelia]|uniref:CBS domain-containing protein n=1 Tax=Paramecium tetraurelia TaxID=5888 RepID=A0CRF7_PARTE|nr:uncharacterized protein GSPATT00009689001 [Paramecium tetraurelia]CAK73374.1 unnamed protein product [Paramecium tetraurelia]|eukprot:XP_001440771.1 hypothetical protein (macronuclear) [Paramecium tetraurelia strain d4-2]
MLSSNWRNGIQTALTFDDVLMVPQYSTIESRTNCIVETHCSQNIKLKIPFISSPMDTVTETEMAIHMAANGGLGVIHRFMTANEQVEQIKKVKRSEAYIKNRPFVVGLNYTLKKVLILAEEWKCKTFLVTDDNLIENNEDYEETDETGSPRYKSLPLLGIITNRDCYEQPLTKLVKELMTPREKLVTLHYLDVSKENARQMMLSHKLEKLPVVDDKNNIKGLINLKDLKLDSELKVLDQMGRLIVGGAVGANDDEITRAKRLVNSGCDVIVLDVANGHSQLAIRTVEQLKKEVSVDVIAGSIATGDGARRLIQAGADGIRCGIGNGSICITRVVSGCGVPQFSALMDVAPVCKEYKIPLMSDGGNKNSGNMCKALAVGADCIMLGRLLAGCQESPSKEIYREGKILKVYRGMAGFGANVSKAQRTGKDEPSSTTFAPEGVEGYIPFAGKVSIVLEQFKKGIQSGMSYCGASNIEELQKNVQFIQMTNAGFVESGVHGITKI